MRILLFLALKKGSGTTVSKDYRDKEVIAAYEYIPEVKWGFIVKQDLEEINKPINYMLSKFVIALIVLICSVYVIAIIISKTIYKPVLNLADVAKRIQSGDVDARCVIETADEMSIMGSSINTMADALLQRNQVQRSVGELMEAMVGTNTVNDYASMFLEKIMEKTDSYLGAFYRINKDRKILQPIWAIGMSKEQALPFSVENFEGQFGVALSSEKVSYVGQLSEEKGMRFKTIAGEIVLNEMVTIPLLVKNKVMAIIAMATINKYNQTHRAIIEMSWIAQQTAFSNLISNETTEYMANELRQNNEELASTNEELHIQSEELREQARMLRKLTGDLEEEQRRARESDRLKSEFLSNMSHELRTPLNSIMALSQLMLTRGTGKDQEQEREYLRVIERNGGHLLNLINDILDLAKIESGRVELEEKEIDIKKVVLSASQTIKPMVQKKGLEIAIEVENVKKIYSDEEKIRRILLNLLSNAVKFTEKGRIDITVTT